MGKKDLYYKFVIRFLFEIEFTFDKIISQSPIRLED